MKYLHSKFAQLKARIVAFLINRFVPDYEGLKAENKELRDDIYNLVINGNKAVGLSIKARYNMQYNIDNCLMAGSGTTEQTIGVMSKSDKFAQILILKNSENIGDAYDLVSSFSDNEYIEFCEYEKQEKEAMYGRGSSGGHIVFHGGCLRCKSQYIHGVDRCRGCCYFRAEWNKSDLSLKQ